ncbi:CHAT domain-containing protein [Nannocystis sp.]|uniref:CHAT domain-containing protein n=1 Tax=Nannocystis sp. TaxID=1962667 RepID=UPI0025E522D3|nr:CHAT domain-containing protein [Nannocystis sp.]MBK7828405.1 CHAT domain-containing protein [Nannocystis sp.]
MKDGTYEEELRLVDPEAATMSAPVRGLVKIDFPKMRSLELKPDVYGDELTQCVFADKDVLGLYIRARTVMSKHKLRLSIAIEPSEHELNDLRWELLRDPVDKKLLATSDDVWLSRFMFSKDWRSVPRHSRTQLRAVIAVAAPTDYAEWQLAEIKLDDEIARGRNALSGIPVEVLGDTEPCTLDRLIKALRGGADIVYLVCHGIHRSPSAPSVYLQNESGQTEVVHGKVLADRIGDMAEAPRMMVLASCESATRLEYSLATMLADAGVSAVLAMQGKISMATVKGVMPPFFHQLFIDGQIDRALAIARGGVRAHSDAWMPALFLRLKNGQLWYEPRLTGSNNAPPQWKALCQCVRNGARADHRAGPRRGHVRRNACAGK